MRQTKKDERRLLWTTSGETARLRTRFELRTSLLALGRDLWSLEQQNNRRTEQQNKERKDKKINDAGHCDCAQ